MAAGRIDLYDPGVYEREVPHEAFAYLRREAPVYWHPEPTGPGFWAVTRYDDVVAVSRDAVTYSSHVGTVLLNDQDPQSLAQQQLMMLNQDPPSHTRLRSLVNRGFTPRMIARLHERVRALCAELVDELAAKGTSDFVHDVAAQLPLAVIADLLGAPAKDRDQIFEWSNRMIGFDDPEFQTSPDDGRTAAFEMFAYANEVGRQRREEPRDDIVTKLIQPDDRGDVLDELEFDMFFLLLAVAGNETTRNSISHGVRAFCDYPDQYQLLVEDPTRAQLAAEEVVRWASPVMYFRRNVTKDTEIRGQEIKAGDKVSIWYISANRDEDVFDDPFTFDITRDPNEHVGFGGGGPHHCLGSNLARMEIYVLLEEMARRIPSLELVGDVPPLRSNFIAGIKHMPVKYPAGKREVS
jgi:cholest-4-en-3-one 26-monooxygenase